MFKFDEDFIKNYDEDSDKGYFLAVDFEYPKKCLNVHGDLPFLTERKKIKKCNKLTCNINGKKKNCRSHKGSETSIKSWTNIKESTLSNSV